MAILNLAQTARALGCSPTTVRRRVDAGDLYAERVGGGSKPRYRFDADEIAHIAALEASAAQLRHLGVTAQYAPEPPELADHLAREDLAAELAPANADLVALLPTASDAPWQVKQAVLNFHLAEAARLLHELETDLAIRLRREADGNA